MGIGELLRTAWVKKMCTGGNTEDRYSKVNLHLKNFLVYYLF